MFKAIFDPEGNLKNWKEKCSKAKDISPSILPPLKEAIEEAVMLTKQNAGRASKIVSETYQKVESKVVSVGESITAEIKVTANNARTMEFGDSKFRGTGIMMSAGQKLEEDTKEIVGNAISDSME